MSKNKYTAPTYPPVGSGITNPFANLPTQEIREKPFKQKTLRIVIKGDNVFLDNHCNIGRGLRQNSYVDKKHLLHLIKQMIDWDYDEITDTPKKRQENRRHAKWLANLRKGK